MDELLIPQGLCLVMACKEMWTNYACQKMTKDVTNTALTRSLARPPACLLSLAHKIICRRKMLLRRKKGGLCAVWLTIMAAASNIKALESARAVVGILRA
jgi:hypothetical protein